MDPRAQAFFDALYGEIRAHRAVNHPLLHRIARGEIDPQQRQRFALHYYEYILPVRRYIPAVHANVTDERIQIALARILYDEYGECQIERTHVSLYKKFMRACGLTCAEWDHVQRIPELDAYIDTHFRLCKDGPALVGLGAMGPASEWPVPMIFEQLVQGFRKLGMTDDDLEIFLIHIPLDRSHASLIMQAIAPYVVEPAGQREVLLGARRSIAARELFMDGLYRAVFGEAAPCS